MVNWCLIVWSDTSIVELLEFDTKDEMVSYIKEKYEAEWGEKVWKEFADGGDYFTDEGSFHLESVIGRKVVKK